jgi:hypothetical protein
MTGAVDYSASAVKRLAARLSAIPMDMTLNEFDEAAAILRALRDALDEAERERDEALGEAKIYRDATGYARGVRDAAACCDAAKADALKHYGSAESVGADMAKNRILALLPEKKETNDE